MIKTFVTICMMGIVTSNCNSKNSSQMNKDGEVKNEQTMIVGAYSPGGTKGLYSFRFNQETGVATPLQEAEIGNPSYLTYSADGKLLYAVSEFGDERAAVNTFSFNKDKGSFKFLNTQKNEGEDPCYIETNGSFVITANYSGGSINVFPIAKDGTLLPASQVIKFEGTSADKKRQEKPHLHCARITPDGKYLFADDLGTDQIHKFVINANAKNNDALLKEGVPSSYKVEPGSGPRHLTFSPNEKYAYLINELSGSVYAFEYNDGVLTPIQKIQADTVGGRGSADIHISPDGKFLYASNRLKADGLAIFSIQQENGKLTKVGYQLTGIHPRNFIISPNGKFVLVACRNSNIIQIFERNFDTGLLTNTNQDIKIDKPMCIKFIP